MPIFDTEKVINPIEAPIVPKFDSSTVYEGGPGLTEITTIEGTPWEAVFFAQILGAEDYPRRLDFGLDPSLQQYMRINDYVLYVTDGLSAAGNENLITTVTGSANLYPGVNPNQWDLFVAVMSDGKTGLFTVSEPPERKTFYDKSCFSITYELVGYFDPTYQAELIRKTVQVLHYNVDDPTSPGTDSAIVSQEGVTREQLVTLVSTMYDNFYDQKTRTFILTDENNTRLYDPHVVDFFLGLVPTSLRGRRPRIDKYATPTGHYRDSFKTIYDVLMDGQGTRLKLISTQVANVKGSAFHSNHIMLSVFLLDINSIVHQADAPTLRSVIPEDDRYTYVFSDAFYDHTLTEMSELETAVYEAIHNRSFDTALVSDACNNIYTKTDTDQFYLIPILIWLSLKQL